MKNSWSRFQEEQADDLSIRISTQSEIKGQVNSLKRALKEGWVGPSFTTYSKYPFINKIANHILNTHPPPEDRIRKFQKMIGKE